MRIKHLLFTLLLAVLVPWAAMGQTMLLFSEDFEGGSMPEGWTQEYIGNEVFSWSVGTGDYLQTTGAGQGTYNAKIQTSYTGSITRLITPEINLSYVSSAQLSFMHIERSWGGDIDELRVYYRTSSTGTWTLIPGQEYTAEVASWTTEDEIILPDISSTYQIAFEFTSNYGYGVGLDDISIEPAASCLRPVGLTCTNLTATAATLSWTEKGSATNWVIQCCVDPSFMCGDAGIINVSGTPSYTLTCLEPVTTYYVRLKASCGDNNESYWSNAISFTTTNPIPPVVVGNGWADNFEGTEWGWQLINCNLKNQWILGTATNNGGNKSLYISKDNGETNSYDFGEPATVYAAKLFQFDNKQYVFSFDYKVKGEENYDFMRVALVPESVTLEASAGLPTGLDENNLPAGWIPLDGGSQLYSATPTWTPKEFICTPEAGNYYVVFIWRNDSSVDGNPPAAIDNFSITLGCRPTWTGSGSSYYISNFTASCSGMTLLDNASSGTENTTTNYYDTKSIIVEPGDELSCTITMSNADETYGFALWADFDGDGLEQAERMFATSSHQASPYTGTFTIPANTPAGEYRLRVLGDYNNATPSEPCGSYQYGEAEDYKLIVTCSNPTGLVVADGYPTAHSVSFTWDYEPGDVFEYSLPGDYVTDPEMVTWNSTWYAGEDFPVWLNLQPNKDYSFWLRRKCGDDSFSSPVCVFFHTLQIPVEVPFSDNFENGNDWRLLNGSQTNQWAWGTAPDNGNNHSLYISNDGGGHNTYTNDAPSIVYATKLLSFAESGYYSFAYTWKNHGEGVFGDTGGPTPFDYLRVVLAPGTVELTPGELPTGLNASSLPEGWIALDGGHCLSGQDEWMLNYEEAYVEAGVYTMVLVWRNDNSGGRNPAVVDDVSISSVSCPRPTDPVVNEVTYDYVAFTINSEIGAVYQYCIVDANSNVYENMFESNTTSPATGTEYSVYYPLNGFELQTEYGIYVRKKCGEGDYSLLASTSFTTLNHCATMPIASLPYTENFDTYTNVPTQGIHPLYLPECWSYINATTDNQVGSGNEYYPTMYGGNSHSADNYLELTCESYFITNHITFDAQPQYAILPPIENVNLTKMTLWARADNTLYDPEHPSWYHYDATFKVGVMTDPDDASTFTEVASFNPSSTNYVQYTLFFAGYTGNGSYIAIKIEPYEAVNQAETYIRSVFIDDVIVEKPCPMPTDFAASNVTAYTADFSWNGSSYVDAFDVRYRTAAAVYDEPSLSEGFENGLGNWTFTSMNAVNDINATGNNHAGIHADGAHSGSYGFRFSSYSSKTDDETYDQYLVTPELTVTGNLKFYAKHYGTGDDIYVGYSTTTNDLDDFTWDETALDLSTNWQEFTHELPNNVKYVAFHYFGDYQYYAYVDDITISQEVSQPAGEWQYVENIAAWFTTLDGLTPETAYEAQVKSGCSDDWSEIISFTTIDCTAPTEVTVSDILHNSATVSWAGTSDSYNVSYRESAGDFVYINLGFEHGLSDWTFMSINAANDIGLSNGAGVMNNTQYHSNYFSFRFSSYNKKDANETYDQYLFSPELNKTGTLKFWFKKSDPAATENLYVGYSTTTNELDAFTWSEDLVPTTTWQEYSQDLPSDVKYVALHYFGNYQFYVFVDDITIGAYGVSAGDWQTVTTTDGANTTTLTGLTTETQYDVKVQAACGEESDEVVFTTLSHNLMLFVHEGNWNNPDNWIPVGLPTVNQDVELRADVTIPSGYLAQANFINTNTNSITIEDGGQLYHYNGIVATVKKMVTGYGSENHDTNNGYILLAHPHCLDINIPSTNDATNIRTGTYDLYKWNRLGDDEGREWINYGANNSSTLSMEDCKGYLYANQNDTELTFTASIRGNGGLGGSAINNLYYTAPTNEHMFSAWHLIGNPFVCDAYLVSENTYGSALPYYRMNSEGNGLIAVTTADPVAPMEGVFYESPSSGNGTSIAFDRTQPVRGRSLNINLSRANTRSNAVIDNAIIRFDEGLTMGKLSFREGSSKVYIPGEGKDLAVAQAEGQVGEIPFNFEAEHNGTYTLSFNTEGVAFSYLHLIDNLTGNDVDLLTGTSTGLATYTFEAQPTDDAHRFKLAFSLGDGDMENWTSNISEPDGLRDTNTTPLVPKHALTENQDASVFTQAIALATGWNWWAPVVQITAAQLRTALGNTLLQLKSKNGEVETNDNLVPGQMYKLQTNTVVENVTLEGVIVPTNISIEYGANWIGYTGTTANIATALGNFVPTDGDKIISQDGGFAIFDGNSYTWQGTLTQLTHGQGYVYFSKDTETKALYF